MVCLINCDYVSLLICLLMFVVFCFCFVLLVWNCFGSTLLGFWVMGLLGYAVFDCSPVNTFVECLFVFD